jgi:hypothetical protein
MKFCSRCKTEKSESEFNKHAGKPDGLQPFCKLCHRTSSSYENTRVTALEWQRKRRDENRTFVWEYLSTHPCVDCGETDIVVLEFDHMENKKAVLSVLVCSTAGLKRIKDEIAKCLVRCANCHRRKTARDLGHKKLIWQLTGQMPVTGQTGIGLS